MSSLALIDSVVMDYKREYLEIVAHLVCQIMVQTHLKDHIFSSVWHLDCEVRVVLLKVVECSQLRGQIPSTNQGLE